MAFSKWHSDVTMQFVEKACNKQKIHIFCNLLQLNFLLSVRFNSTRAIQFSISRTNFYEIEIDIEIENDEITPRLVLSELKNKIHKCTNKL